MVQVIKTENPQGKLADMLGLSLGQGIGNGLNTFFANRSLESVMKDKSLEGAPVSKKMEALRSALSPYGEKGKEILDQRMQIEQQEMKEKETIKQEGLQKLKGKALGKLTKGQELSEDEWARFTPQEVAALQKAYHPQPAGGITAQPIPQEQISAIEDFIKNNPEATSDELSIGLGKAGVNPVYSNPYIENRRRQEENQVKQTTSENKIANANDIKFHEESKEYSDKVRNEAKSARQKLDTIEPIIKSVENGDIKPVSMANFFRFFGATGSRLADAFMSGKQSELNFAVPEFLEGRKEIFGVRLSDADLKILQDKLPDIGKSPEANLKILNLMKKYAKASLLKQEAAESILEEKGISTRSGKIRPLQYENLVEHKFEELQNEEENGVLMRLPDGREVPIQRSKIKEAESLGASRVKK